MKIEFSKEEQQDLKHQLQAYFERELDEELGDLGAQFLLEFISEKLGVYFYNRGLSDAQKILELKLDDIRDAIFEIEKPTVFKKS